MTITERLRMYGGRFGRAVRAFSEMPGPAGPPRVPKIGIPTAAWPSGATDETLRIIRSREALQGMISTGAGPQLTRYSTYPATALDPYKIVSILQNADRGVTWQYADMVFQVLQRDAHMAGVDRARRVETANKDFRVHAVNKSEVALLVREYLQAVTDGIDSFDLAMYAALSANAVGWSCEEIAYTPSKLSFPHSKARSITVNGLHPRSLHWVHPKHFWWTYDNDEPLIDLGPSGRVELPPFKFLFHSAVGEGQFETRGYMRQAIWLHLFKQQATANWSVFLNLFGLPNIYAKIPRELFENDEMKAIVKLALQEYGQGQPAVVPDTITDIDAKPGPIGSGADRAHSMMVNWCNEELSKLIQSETLTTQSGGSGSYALGETHEATKFGVVKMDASGLAGDVRRDLFRAVVELNIDELAKQIGYSPDEIRAVIPRCSWRIEREVTPLQRAQITSIGVNELGAEIDEDQFLETFAFDKPRPGGRALRGKAVVVSQGGATASALDAAGGVDNPVPLPQEQRP